MLQELKVNEFISELASNSPAPGGGSVAALSASIAAALNSMVFNLTVGKKIYNEYDKEVQSKIDESLMCALTYSNDYLAIMEKDTAEFLSLMEAFKLPKGTEEEIVLRKGKIKEGYLKSLQVPFELANKAYELYKHIELAAQYGNPNAISDAGVSALMLQASIEGAVLNVRINLTNIDDENYKEEVRNRCEILVNDGRQKRDLILQKVYKSL